jgi:AraC family transcriptional regulator, transcriptional activator FtrA
VTVRSVVALAIPGVQPFELGVACEGFGNDRTGDGVPAYDFAVVSEDVEPVPTSLGWTINTEHRFDRADEADLVIVPAAGDRCLGSSVVLDLLRRTVDRGAIVASICSGAFVLGDAGLLDGRDCTTHWRHAEQLAREFPKARVNPNVLYICDGPVYTSAGTAAGLDLCLHIIREDYGAAVANAVARRMVMPPHRDGGQAQYIAAPMANRPGGSLGPVIDDILTDLGSAHTVDSMASVAMMSPRTFARRFRDEVGSSPHAWLTQQRVLRARAMLESSDEPVESIATAVGFGDATVLRHHFGRQVGTSPVRYRRAFRTPR